MKTLIPKLKKAAKPAKLLPGEKHPFREAVRNLTPPQHLEGRQVTSSRKVEVTKEDPLLHRIRELESELASVRAALARAEARLAAPIGDPE